MYCVFCFVFFRVFFFLALGVSPVKRTPRIRGQGQGLGSSYFRVVLGSRELPDIRGLKSVSLAVVVVVSVSRVRVRVGVMVMDRYRVGVTLLWLGIG